MFLWFYSKCSHVLLMRKYSWKTRAILVLLRVRIFLGKTVGACEAFYQFNNLCWGMFNQQTYEENEKI